MLTLTIVCVMAQALASYSMQLSQYVVSVKAQQDCHVWCTGLGGDSESLSQSLTESRLSDYHYFHWDGNSYQATDAVGQLWDGCLINCGAGFKFVKLIFLISGAL